MRRHSATRRNDCRCRVRTPRDASGAWVRTCRAISFLYGFDVAAARLKRGSLLQADALLTHDGRPLLQFRLDLPGENVLAAADCFHAELLQCLLHAWRCENSVGPGVQEIDDRLGCAGRSE